MLSAPGGRCTGGVGAGVARRCAARSSSRLITCSARTTWSGEWAPGGGRGTTTTPPSGDDGGGGGAGVLVAVGDGALVGLEVAVLVGEEVARTVAVAVAVEPGRVDPPEPGAGVAVNVGVFVA